MQLKLETLKYQDLAIQSVVKLDMPNPEPKSQSIKFQDEWQKDWKEASFVDVIKRWKKE